SYLVGIDTRACVLPGLVDQPEGLASRGRPGRRGRGLAAVVLVHLARQPHRVLLLRDRLPAVPGDRDHVVYRPYHWPGERTGRTAGHWGGDRRSLSAACARQLRLPVSGAGRAAAARAVLAATDVVPQLDLTGPRTPEEGLTCAFES